MPKEFPGNLNLFYLYSLRMLFVKIKPANTWAAIHLQNKDIPSQPSKPRENKLFWIKYAQYFIRLRIKYAYYSFRIKYVRYVSFNYDSRQDIYICGFDPGPQRFKTLRLPYIVRWRNSCKVAYVGRVGHVTPKILRACIYSSS